MNLMISKQQLPSLTSPRDVAYMLGYKQQEMVPILGTLQMQPKLILDGHQRKVHILRSVTGITQSKWPYRKSDHQMKELSSPQMETPGTFFAMGQLRTLLLVQLLRLELLSQSNEQKL